MATPIPDSLERLSQADLIGVVRDLIGEVGRLRAENEKLVDALTKLKAEHQAIKDELARLKKLPPRPPTQHHPPAVAGNPDASRCFAGRASDAPVPRGPADRDGSSGSADRQRAGRDIAPPAHSRRHSRSGHGRSSCRSAPERGNAYTRTAGPALAPAQARPHMDDVRNAWNNAPACVLGTVWGTASIRTWRFRSAPCLPIRQVITAPLCARHTPSCRRARARLWVCG
jgi:hypothetical protein